MKIISISFYLVENHEETETILELHPWATPPHATGSCQEELVKQVTPSPGVWPDGQASRGVQTGHRDF